MTNTANAPFSKLILKGNTSQNGEPTPSSPVDINTVTGNQNVRILGKNFVNTFYRFARSRTISKNGITLTIKDNGKLDIQGTATTDTGINIDADIYLDENKDYFFSSNIKYDATNFNLSAQYLDSNNKTVYWLSGNKIDRTKYSGERINVIYYISANTVANLHDVEIQIEEGNTATTYEPYQGNTYPLSLGSMELCKIGDYQDYIYKKDDKWWKHKEISKITNWDTDWYINTSWNKSYPNIMHIQANVYSKNKITKHDGKTDIITLITTHMPSVLIKNRDYNKEQCFSHYENGCITFFINKSRLNLKDNSSESDILNAFANYMNNNKVVAYFAANTPTDEQITDTTLITQLNEISQAVSYDGTTNISQTNANLPFIINAEAFKKIS